MKIDKWVLFTGNISLFDKEFGMDIPGIASFTNQPTITSPLDKESSLRGQTTPALDQSETKSTVNVTEKSTQSVDTSEVVNQSNETQATGFNLNNPGGSIDLTV